jgi:hypothetical protein
MNCDGVCFQGGHTHTHSLSLSLPLPLSLPPSTSQDSTDICIPRWPLDIHSPPVQTVGR